MTSRPWQQLSEHADELAALAARAREIVTLANEAAARSSSDAVALGVESEVARRLTASAAALQHSAEAVVVLGAGLVGQHRAHRDDADATPGSWLARNTGISRRDAAAVLRRSATVERFEQVAAAFADGRLTAGHVNAVGDIIPARFRGETLEAAIAQVRDIEEIIVEVGSRFTVEEFTKFCRRIRGRLDLDGPTPDTPLEASRVSLVELFNGRWALSGDLSASDGALLKTMLDRHLARDTNANTNPDTTNTGEERVERRLFAERLAEGLVQLVGAGAGAGRPGRVALFAHVDLGDIDPADHPDVADLLTDTGRAFTESGLDIDDDTLWALLAGDGTVTPVFTRDGHPLSYGRERRLAPEPLRRVLAGRDRRCRFPDCDRPAVWLKQHHLVHWEDGGSTDPDHLAGTCNNHHHAHHDRGFTIHTRGNANNPDDLWVTRPDGTPYDPTPAYRRITQPTRAPA